MGKIPVFALVIYLLSIATAFGQDDLNKGGIVKTIPNGSDSIVVDLVNKTGKYIYDFDIAINTPGAAQNISEADMDGVTGPNDNTHLDDNNNDKLDSGENDDTDDSPGKATRIEVSNIAYKQDPNDQFKIEVKLDAVAGVGGVDIQITPTDKEGDAYVYVPPLDTPTVALTVNIPAGSNDAAIGMLNQSDTVIKGLKICVPSGAIVDSAHTSSTTFPTIVAYPECVVFKGASVPPWSVADCNIQWDIRSAAGALQQIVLTPLSPKIGGVGVPPDKLGLLAPWIAVLTMIMVCAVSVIIWKRRRGAMKF